MSPDEMREFCHSVSRFDLRVKVRLKNASTILVGKVTAVEPDRFRLETTEETQDLRYAWIARICNS